MTTDLKDGTYVGFTFRVLGNHKDNDTAVPQSRWMIQGGKTEVNEAHKWFAEGAGGGDLAVVRVEAPGVTGALTEYFWGSDMEQLWGAGPPGINSVRTIAFQWDGTTAGLTDAQRAAKGRKAADESIAVQHYLRKSEAVYFAGGDQSKYVTVLETTASKTILDGKTAVMGGNSSGAQLLGDIDELSGSSSQEALENPNANLKLKYNFFNIAPLAHTIVDTHFRELGNELPADRNPGDVRGRMGRLVADLAKINADKGSPYGVKGIGLDAYVALKITPDGHAKVVVRPGKTGYAYFVRPTPAATQMAPLMINNVSVLKIGDGGEFDLTNWTAVSGLVEWYDIEATGTVTSDLPWLRSNSSTKSPYGGMDTADMGNNEPP